MLSKATTDILPYKKGRKRLTEAQASWTFTPLEEGKVRVSNTAHINPGTNLPGWITNMLLVETPHATMASFIAEVNKPSYKNALVSFVQEPDGQ